MPPYRVLVYRSRKLVESLDLDIPVVVGRQDLQKNDPPPIAVHRHPEDCRLVVAGASEKKFTRNSFRISGDDGGRIVIENLHPEKPVSISHGSPILCGDQRTFDSDVLIDLGADLAIRIENAVTIERAQEEERSHLRTLTSIPPAPGTDEPSLQTVAIHQFATPEAEEIAKMLRLALQVVQKAAASDAFFQAAALAATEIIDLDRAVVLLRGNASGVGELAADCSVTDDWCKVGEHCRTGLPGGARPEISRTIREQVVQTARTFIHDGDVGSVSLEKVCFAAASPILNRDREVIGVLYGDRWVVNTARTSYEISNLEAALLEILAGSVAGGIARQAEERQRNRLSEFFSPKVTSLLANKTGWMDGQDAEVSVLFCDVRGFSTVTEKLGPRNAIAWINDVMSELSQCVIDRDGVLVDYVGDELLAMWGAPGEQPDHAVRALDAARAMMAAIETLRARWSDVLPQRFGAGIGLNTGAARVGNVGSRQKFKYGAIGNTVNAGSRLQSATKQLGVDCVASGDTIRAAHELDHCRRLAQLSVVGIERAMDVYEVVCQRTETWTHLAKNYELALADFEAQRFGEAARRIGELVQSHPQDRPCKKLLGRAVAELDEPSENFTPVWNLTAK